MKYSTDGYHTLRIRDTTISDEGVYMVHAANTGGTATSVAQLYIDTVKSIDTSSHISSQTLNLLQRRWVVFAGISFWSRLTMLKCNWESNSKSIKLFMLTTK